MTKQYVIHGLFIFPSRYGPYSTLEEAKQTMMDKCTYPEPIEWFVWINTKEKPMDRKPVVCGAQTIEGHRFILPYEIHEEEV